MPEIHTEKAIDSPRVIAEMSGLNSEADEGCDCLDVRGERRIGHGPELVAAPSRSFSFIPMRASFIPIVMQTEPQPVEHPCICLTPCHFGLSPLRGSGTLSSGSR